MLDRTLSMLSVLLAGLRCSAADEGGGDDDDDDACMHADIRGGLEWSTNIETQGGY